MGRIGNGEMLTFELLEENDYFEVSRESGIIRTRNEVQVKNAQVQRSRQ